MMVVHVDPADADRLRRVVPARPLVEIPGHGRRPPQRRLRARRRRAADRDVPRRTSTCRSHHFLEVDFQGFQKIVDTIGHVDIYFPTAGARPLLRAESADAAAVSSTATQALTYVRARATTSPDGSEPEPQNSLTTGRGSRAAISTASSASSTSCAAWARPRSTRRRPESRRPRSRCSTTSRARCRRTRTSKLERLKALDRHVPRPRPVEIEMLTLPMSARRPAARSRRASIPDAEPVLDRLRTFSTPPRALPVAARADEVKVRVVDGSGDAKGARPRCSTTWSRHGLPIRRRGRDARPQRLPDDPGPLDAAPGGARAHRGARRSAPANARRRPVHDESRRRRDVLMIVGTRLRRLVASSSSRLDPTALAPTRRVRRVDNGLRRTTTSPTTTTSRLAGHAIRPVDPTTRRRRWSAARNRADRASRCARIATLAVGTRGAAAMTPLRCRPRAFVHRFFVALRHRRRAGHRVRHRRGIWRRDARSRRSVRSASTRGLLTEGGNYLIIGSDSRAFVERRERRAEHFGDPRQQTGQRSDTIMVAHIDPDSTPGCSCRSRVTCGSTIPGHRQREDQRRVQRRPAAASSTRSSRTSTSRSATTSRSTSPGSVTSSTRSAPCPIYFPTPARDKKTGLDDRHRGLPQPQRRARRSRYVRSRYYQYVRRREVARRPHLRPRPHPAPAVLHPLARATRR